MVHVALDNLRALKNDHESTSALADTKSICPAFFFQEWDGVVCHEHKLWEEVNTLQCRNLPEKRTDASLQQDLEQGLSDQNLEAAQDLGLEGTSTTENFKNPLEGLAQDTCLSLTGHEERAERWQKGYYANRSEPPALKHM